MTCQDCEGRGEACQNIRCGKIEEFCNCKRPAIAECRNCKGSGVEADDLFPSPDARYGYNDALSALGDI